MKLTGVASLSLHGARLWQCSLISGKNDHCHSCFILLSVTKKNKFVSRYHKTVIINLQYELLQLAGQSVGLELQRVFWVPNAWDGRVLRIRDPTQRTQFPNQHQQEETQPSRTENFTNWSLPFAIKYKCKKRLLHLLTKQNQLR